MSKLTVALQQVVGILEAADETEFSELKRKDRQQIFDILFEAADDYDIGGDDYTLYMTLSFPELSGGLGIGFIGQGVSGFPEDVRKDVRELYLVEDSVYDDPLTLDNIHVLIARYSAPTTVINLTPHAVRVIGDSGGIVAEFPASGTVARVNSSAEALPSVNGIPVVRTVYCDIDGLPDPQPNTVYIVSIVVAQALGSPRSDVYVPDTGPASVVRDGNGQIVGVRRLMRL